MSWMPTLDSFEGVAGAARAPMLALSALEWQVIGLAIREAGRFGGGRIRAVAGNSAFQIGGELSAEEQQSHMAWSFRASLKVGL